MSDSPTDLSGPIALELPNELWIDILSNHSLDCKTVKRCSQICKRFHGLVKSSTLDKVLFRAPPSPIPLTRGTTVAVHPVFDLLDLLTCKRGELVCYQELDNRNQELNNFATSPALKKLAIVLRMTAGGRGFHSFEEEYVDNPEGVRVMDVVQKVADRWAEVWSEGKPWYELWQSRDGAPWEGFEDSASVGSWGGGGRVTLFGKPEPFEDRYRDSDDSDADSDYY